MTLFDNNLLIASNFTSVVQYVNKISTSGWKSCPVALQVTPQCKEPISNDMDSNMYGLHKPLVRQYINNDADTDNAKVTPGSTFQVEVGSFEESLPEHQAYWHHPWEQKYILVTIINRNSWPTPRICIWVSDSPPNVQPPKLNSMLDSHRNTCSRTSGFYWSHPISSLSTSGTSHDI